MKQLIYHMAMMLMLRNTKVSNLEIKNALHSIFNTDGLFSLTQSEVSSTMSELAGEHGWNVDFNTSSGITFKEYSIPQIVGTDDPDYIDSEDVDDSDSVTVIMPSIQSVTAPAPSTSLTFRKAISSANGDLIGYVSGQPDLYVQGFSRREVRNQCFNKFKSQVPGLVYDNINTCSTAYFNRRHL